MKKLLMIFALAIITIAVNAQGLFKPVQPFAVKVNNFMMVTEPVKLFKWQMRFDATVSFAEVNYNKAKKVWQTNQVFGIGPAFGIQHYVPKSDTDPTPFNNYGFSGAVLLGEKLKFAIQADLMQYFKLGVTITPNPQTDIHSIGFFFGGGITF
jgi:hypothetical protein